MFELFWTSLLATLVFIVNKWDVFYISNAVSISYEAHPVSLNCSPHIPCEYPEEVDLRIIVMTFNRSGSLMTLLKNLDNLELDDATAALEIWIDRDKKGAIDSKTVQVAEAFRWSRGLKRVHHQLQHVGIYGQWIDTWRAQPGSKEIALFLEDDLSISPYTWRWLKAVHQQYKDDVSCAGYTLQSEGVMNAETQGPFKFPKNDTVFMYQLVPGDLHHIQIFGEGFKTGFTLLIKLASTPMSKD
jgi:hypothetical protein